MIFKKHSQKISINLISYSRIFALFSSSKTSKQFNQKLSSGKLLQVLGFHTGTNLSALSDSQIKRQYLSMIKKYHSDGVTDPQEKIQNEQITKCIISAYDRISTERAQYRIQKGLYENIYQDQDQVAMKIFGKRFNEVKYELFKEGNSNQRAIFMDELQRIRRGSKQYSYERQEDVGQEYQEYVKRTRDKPFHVKFSDDFATEMMKIVMPALGVLGVLTYLYWAKRTHEQKEEKAKRQAQRLTLTQQQVQQINKKSTEAYQKKLNDLINSFTQQQPPSLKYSSGQDPQQIQQLIEYTIGPDIQLFEVPAELLSNQHKLEKLKTLKDLHEVRKAFDGEFFLFQLNKIKVNSAITLSLQAERCLQNIYIKVKDVAEEIEETGKYTPPKVFFRFYGYVMFDIRQKPLALTNYRDTQYISLFDLFFDYYSPIPLKRHQYNEYLVGFTDEDLKMYGQVHLNHRKIPERYISKEDKIVVMRDNIAFDEDKYAQIWNHFYRKYMRIWKRDYGDRISTEHL